MNPLPQKTTPITVTLTRNNQHLEVQPPLACLKRRLRVKAVHFAKQTTGMKTVSRSMPLHQSGVVTAGRQAPLVYGAGLAPVIRKILENEGVRIIESGFACPPLKNPAQFRSSPKHPDLYFLHCVQQHERALIRYRDGEVELAWLIAQVAKAWPKLRLVCLVRNYQQGRNLRDALKKYLARENVYFFNRTDAPDLDCRIAVATSEYLHHPSVAASKRDIVLLPDLLQCLSNKAREALDQVGNARVYGFLREGEDYSQLDEAQMRARVGFEEIYIPKHGHIQRDVRVTWHRITGETAAVQDERMNLLASPFDMYLGKMPVRNEKIALLARRLSQRNPLFVKKNSPSIARHLTCGRRPRVRILVETLTHAIHLCKLLDGWPVFCGDSVCKNGLKKADLKQLEQHLQIARPWSDVGIITAAALKVADLSKIDVLIRGSTGNVLPRLTHDHLICPQELIPSPLLLIDVNDWQYRGILGSKQRRQSEYRQQGWYAPGADPVAERVTDFLARCD